MIICNTDEIENAEMEKEIIKEQKHNNIDAFIICPAPGSDTKDMLKKQCAKTPYTLIMEDVYSKEGGNSGNPVIGSSSCFIVRYIFIRVSSARFHGRNCLFVFR